RWKALSVHEVLLVVVPGALYFTLVSAAGVDIGIRYVLPVICLIIIFAARVASCRSSSKRFVRAAVVLAIALNGASIFRAYPEELAYFNEIVGGPRGGYRWLADSNLDWGQGFIPLRAKLETFGSPVIYLAYP